jgi:nucleoside 2-deoxyribosyltransferase
MNGSQVITGLFCAAQRTRAEYYIRVGALRVHKDWHRHTAKVETDPSVHVGGTMTPSPAVEDTGPLIYVAAPLFNEMEIGRNREVKRILLMQGYRVYLPQEDAGISYEILDGTECKAAVRKRIFDQDVRAVATCDVLLCLLDGRVPDEGMCIELGMAFALGKPCVGYKTDFRAMDERGDNNIMLDGCLNWRIARTTAQLIEILGSLTGTT